jgi:isopenicillin N synthase-like dioxygenase
MYPLMAFQPLAIERQPGLEMIVREFAVPVIDLAALDSTESYKRQALARAVDDALCAVGFMTIVNHGVPESEISSLQASARGFFSQSLDLKLQSHRSLHQGRGYSPPNTIASGRYDNNKDAPADLMESFALGPFQPPVWATAAAPEMTADGANIWPESLPEFRSTMESYYRHLEHVALKLMRVFALALRLEEEYFVGFHSPHNSVLRLNLYAALTRTPLPGQLRIGEHTDVGGFTVLLADPNSGGLQIADDMNRWHDVPYIPNSFVINLGEMLKTWTNDRWRATRHRVVNPRNDQENVDRLSVPFFVNPRAAALISCIPTCVDPGKAPIHEPVVAGEFRQRRLAQQRVLQSEQPTMG